MARHLAWQYMFTKYLDPNMVSTRNMGFRVTLVNHMCLKKKDMSFKNPQQQCI